MKNIKWIVVSILGSVLVVGLVTALLAGLMKIVRFAGDENGADGQIGRSDAPIVATDAQSTSLGWTRRMENCQDVSSSIPNAAFNYLSVLHAPLNSLGYTWEDIGNGKVPLSVISELKTTLLKAPQYGIVQSQSDGYFWLYKPSAGYIGKDSVSFLIESKGRRFEVVWNLNVVGLVNEFLESPACLDIFKDG